MSTEKLHFTKEKETMLMMLSGKAIQSQWKKPILPDPWAVDAMKHIDYDMRQRFNGLTWNLFGDLGCMIIATRAATFDQLTKRYLADHPDATVLHLGCGMDSRVFRVDPPASVNWYDVDYPDAIEVRRKLFPDRPSYHLIGSPLDDLHWMDNILGDHPVLALAEGVMPYLTEAEVKALLNAVTSHFPSGEIIFDSANTMIVKQRGSNVGGTGATFRWGLDDPQDIKRLEPKLQLVKEFRHHDLTASDRFPFWVRGMYRVMEISPTLARMERVLIYRF